jgi:transcriptional regulator with XRE-family HTH domain
MGTPDDLDLTLALARRLKAARALSGKKVRELADELGWSQEKLYRFERGEQEPRALELAAIAGATGASAEFLLGVTSFEEAGTVSSGPTRVKRAAA